MCERDSAPSMYTQRSLDPRTPGTRRIECWKRSTEKKTKMMHHEKNWVPYLQLGTVPSKSSNKAWRRAAMNSIHS